MAEDVETANQVTEVVSFSQIDANAMTMLEGLKFDLEEPTDLKVGDYVARRFTDDLTQRGNIFTSQQPAE